MRSSAMADKLLGRSRMGGPASSAYPGVVAPAPKPQSDPLTRQMDAVAKSQNLLTLGGRITPETIKQFVIGEPEKIVQGGVTQFGDGHGASLSVPNPLIGAVDLAMALPLFGTGMRLARAGGRATIEGMVRPFFSQLAETLKTRVPPRASAEHILNVARKGAKAEELRWTGLEDLLKDPKKLWNRDEVVVHVETNSPVLNERIISNDVYKPTDDDFQKWLEDKYAALAEGKPVVWPSQDLTGTMRGINDRNALNMRDAGKTAREWYDGVDADVRELIRENAQAEMRRNHGPILKPAFTKYTLDGGYNQRELVVTLPNKKKKPLMSFDEFMAAHDQPNPGDNLPAWQREYREYKDSHGMSPAEEGEEALYDDGIDFGTEARPDVGYRVPAGHAYGDSELDVNRLFHARMNDRDGGKTLFLEELQSDWHQTGRENGYGGMTSRPTLKSEYEIITQNDRKYFVTPEGENVFTQDMGYPATMSDDEIREKIIDEAWGDGEGYLDGDGNQIFAELDGGGKVPDAPFKTTWHELGMKRMLQEAVGRRLRASQLDHRQAAGRQVQADESR